MNVLPYVVSASLECVDSALLCTDGVDGFRENLDADLRQMGKNTVWVSAAELKRGMNDFCAGTSLPVVSLDDRYVAPGSADAFLGLSRSVDLELNDAGYAARIGYGPITTQLDGLGRQYGGQEVALVDDVLFSGDMVSWLAGGFARRNIRIGALGCGIAIGEGADKLAALDIPVTSVLAFEEVDDELVEQDFTLLPGSGRKVSGQNSNSLYFDTAYGRPEKWASIPTDFADDFCLQNLRRNVTLLRSDRRAASFIGYGVGTAGEVLSQRLAQLEGERE